MNPSKEKKWREGDVDWEGDEPTEEMEGGEEEAAQLLEPAEEMEGGEEEAAQLLAVGVGGRSTSGRGAAAKAGAGKREGVCSGAARRRERRTPTTGSRGGWRGGGVGGRRWAAARRFQSEWEERRRGIRIGERAAAERRGAVRKSDGGRFSGKCPQNQNFVFLVDKNFGTRGVFRKKYNALPVAVGTLLDPKRNSIKAKGLFEKRHAGTTRDVGSTRSDGRE
jgi:hypothetical protein